MSALRASTIVAATVGTAVTGFIGNSSSTQCLSQPSPLPTVPPPSAFIAQGAPQDLLLPAYAIYFDHKRRNDPEFRKALKRDARREARFERSQREAEGSSRKNAIKAIVEASNPESFPTDIEEREAYFMDQVAGGEVLSKDRMSSLLISTH